MRAPFGQIEQKNYSIVRQIVGDDRYEGEAAYAAMTALYHPLRRFTNFFQPSVQLASKQREGGKMMKRYDVAQTPYERVLAAPTVSATDKERLRMDYLKLNPVALRQQIETAQAVLWRLAGGRNTREATTLYE